MLDIVKAKIIQAARDPDEEGDYLVFEQLVAEAAMKTNKKDAKEKDKDKHKKPEKDASQTHHHGLSSHSKEEPATSTNV